METYLNKDTQAFSIETIISTGLSKGWAELMSIFKNNVQKIDLRPLEMAQAIPEILGELNYLHPETALLFVLHQRLPVFFLTELEDKKFDYHIRVISDGEVDILIFKNK